MIGEATSKLEILLAAASHDVRNALSVIATATSLVKRRGRVDPADVPALARIARATARVEYLMELMATFAALEKGGGPAITPSSCDVAALVREVVAELTSESGRSIAIVADGVTQATVDPTAIRRAAATVVGNALDYSPREANVRVTVRPGDGSVTIEVWNEGPPIPPDLLARIFRPFPHGGARTASRRSLGLGLHVAQALVRAHEGTISAASSEAEGTTFTITLPA